MNTCILISLPIAYAFRSPETSCGDFTSDTGDGRTAAKNREEKFAWRTIKKKNRDGFWKHLTLIDWLFCAGEETNRGSGRCASTPAAATEQRRQVSEALFYHSGNIYSDRSLTHKHTPLCPQTLSGTRIEFIFMGLLIHPDHWVIHPPITCIVTYIKNLDIIQA